MYAATTLLSWVLAVAPVTTTDAEATPNVGDDSTAADGEPAAIVEADEYTTQGGHRVRWASATYSLPEGQIAKVVMTADETASGDAYVFVDGEVVAHSFFDETSGGGSWISSDPDSSELAAAALAGLAGGVGDELLDAFTDGPQEFPCSDYGKKVLRAGKYIWGMVIAGSGAACCAATGGAGCIPCAAATWGLIEAGTEALENYCD